MILQNLRLKNIKSYGGGPDGNGISVNFQSGVNRVAGRNGNGKTTLIEALGYALFFAEPDFDENFSVPVYLLRAGEDEGEIDVGFEHLGQSYRIERGLGRSRRRSKVLQLSDGSTCAEGDEAVANWLCRLLASEKHRFADPRQLSSLFSNLIGVRQGRLTRPFDSKKTSAKEFFEPLLDVAIFRDCSGRLSDAQVRFKALQEEQNLRLARVEERIRERKDSAQRLTLKEAEVETLAQACDKARKRKEELDKLRQELEQRQVAFAAAKQAAESATTQLATAQQRREADQVRVAESQEATSTVQACQPGFQAYLQAEARLRELQQQNLQKQTLQHRRAAADKARTEAEGKRMGAQTQLHDYEHRREQKTSQIESLREQVKTWANHLQESKAAFNNQAESTNAVRRANDWFEHWLATASQQLNETTLLLEEISAEEKKAQDWDSQAVLKTRAEEQRLGQQVHQWQHKLALAEQARQTLAEQLSQIRDGVCPFLKERCRQFDPKAIQSDLAEREKEIRHSKLQHQAAIEAHESAQRAADKLMQKAATIERLRADTSAKIREIVNRQNGFSPPLAEKNFNIIMAYVGSANSLPVTRHPSPVTSSAEVRAIVEANDLAFTAISSLFRQIVPQLEQKIDQFETQRRQRVEQERDLDHANKQLARAEAELNELVNKIEQLKRQATESEAFIASAAARFLELDEKLKAFSNLEADFRQQEQTKDDHAEAHKLYLGAKPLADKLEERRATLQKSSDLETLALEQARHHNERLVAAASHFQPAALEQARIEAAEAGARFAMIERDLKVAQAELRQEKERFKQWKEACAEREKLNEEINRLKAASHLSRLAGKVLKDSAPVVAQHLCTVIAAKAQRIFNQINPEPIQLEWCAEPQYSLRISPGERRFAMLSGGEQTKLALAMTLAMIEQFSGLRFAVFDEPTYGVDGDSRQKLADAIIEAQKAAGLDQLIVVSHDNAFEGKIEHVVLLNKSAGATEVVE